MGPFLGKPDDLPMFTFIFFLSFFFFLFLKKKTFIFGLLGLPLALTLDHLFALCQKVAKVAFELLYCEFRRVYMYYCGFLFRLYLFYCIFFSPSSKLYNIQLVLGSPQCAVTKLNPVHGMSKENNRQKQTNKQTNKHRTENQKCEGGEQKKGGMGKKKKSKNIYQLDFR